MKKIFSRIMAIALATLMLIFTVSCDSVITYTNSDDSKEKPTEPQMIEVPVFASDVEFAKKDNS